MDSFQQDHPSLRGRQASYPGVYLTSFDQEIQFDWFKILLVGKTETAIRFAIKS